MNKSKYSYRIYKTYTEAQEETNINDFILHEKTGRQKGTTGIYYRMNVLIHKSISDDFNEIDFYDVMEPCPACAEPRYKHDNNPETIMVFDYTVNLPKLESVVKEITVKYVSKKKVDNPFIVRFPEEIHKLLTDKIKDEPKEHFFAIFFDGKHAVIGYQVVTVGILNKTQVHPREVFQAALKLNAEGIILAHNHPSGNAEPSSEDKQVTRRLKEAGNIIGITVLDHIILTDDNFYSFACNGLL